MRIAFIGASRFGLRCLDSIQGLAGVETVGAITAPQTFPISYRPDGVTNVLYADVMDYCRGRAIPVVTIGDDGMRGPALLDTARAWGPDAFLVAGWYHMVPRAWRALAPAYGLHASLLPDYSGGAPLVWAIINGEERTGISLFRLGSGVDDGPIVGQAATDIAPEDTIATLYARIEELGVGLLRTHLPRLADGTAVLSEQDEAHRRLVPQRSPDNGLIDWSWPPRRIHDFVRAQTKPYPGAFFIRQGRKWTIWATRVAADRDDAEFAAGAIDSDGDRLLIRCGVGGHGAVELLHLARDGADVSVHDALAELAPG